MFGYSDTWQLVINTGTTVVTFLMVFLIQRSQNKDSLAVQLKLNELVAAMQGASNRLIDVEDLTEEELRALHRHYARLVAMSRNDARLTESHSVEEAQSATRASAPLPPGRPDAARAPDAHSTEAPPGTRRQPPGSVSPLVTAVDQHRPHARRPALSRPRMSASNPACV